MPQRAPEQNKSCTDEEGATAAAGGSSEAYSHAPAAANGSSEACAHAPAAAGGSRLRNWGYAMAIYFH